MSNFITKKATPVPQPKPPTRIAYYLSFLSVARQHTKRSWAISIIFLVLSNITFSRCNGS